MKAAIAGLVSASMIILGGCTDSDHTDPARAITPDAGKTPTESVGSQSAHTRTDEDIQSVFDRHRNRLYELYQVYLKEQPTLQGHVHLRITIEPNGAVSECRIESTDIPSEAFLAEILDSIRQFDFGAKTKAPTTTIIYPINFLPAS